MYARMPYVKPSVATRQLGIDRRTLKKWADDGFISYIRPGGRGQRLQDCASHADDESLHVQTALAVGILSVRRTACF